MHFVDLGESLKTNILSQKSALIKSRTDRLKFRTLVFPLMVCVSFSCFLVWFSSGPEGLWDEISYSSLEKKEKREIANYFNAQIENVRMNNYSFLFNFTKIVTSFLLKF